MILQDGVNVTVKPPAPNIRFSPPDHTLRVVPVAGLSGGRGVPVFVGPTPPTNPPAVYQWIQTGLGGDGTGFTWWFEDGAP